MNTKWNTYLEIYSENSINSKSLPEFFDFYDYSKDFKNVYEPAEDTFLMIDCLKLEQNFLKEKFCQGFQSAEIGCGSGLVSICFLSEFSQISKNKFYHRCVDINDDCVDITKRLFKNYNLSNVDFIKSDLFEYFIQNDLKLDIIIFNPPYVTTDQEELQNAQSKKDISASWAGGERGSEVIYKFINSLEVVHL